MDRISMLFHHCERSAPTRASCPVCRIILQELVGEQATEILPALQNIFIEGSQSSGPVPEGIANFITARELSGHPVFVHRRERKQ